METQTVFPTKPLLRPDQVQTAQDEIKSLEAKLSNPLIQDKGQVRKQLQQAQKLTAEQTPQPPVTVEEEGRMVKRANQLFAEILPTMCSQEEMRKAPPGAVNKYLRGEGSPEVKAKIQEWKHLRLRLTSGTGDRDAANLEVHRPTTSSLNMDSAQIPGKNFFMPDTTGPAVTFSDAQIAYLKSIGFEPGLMSNDQRTVLKDTISGIGLAQPSAASILGKQGAEKRDKRKARVMSNEQKAAMARGRAAAKARKAA